MKSSQLFTRTRLLGTVMPAALLAGTVAVAGIARAQDGVGVETMIVTAQRTEENIQKVPIAVTAFSAASLQTKGITDVSKLSAATPNVTFDASTPFSATSAVLAAAIRGIGQDDFAINLDPGVGVYIDGVFLARSVGANVDMLDVERVEVLKGPQGTLFGRNTIGGAVNIVTRDPGTEFAAKIEVTGGSFQRFDTRGSVDIPVTDKFRTAISFSRKYREGYQKHLAYPAPYPYITDELQRTRLAGFDTSSTSGGQNQWNLRMKFLVEPNDKWKVTLFGDYTLVDEESVPYSVIKVLHGATGIFPPPYPGIELTLADGLFIDLYNACLGLIPSVAPLCGPRATLGTALGGANFDGNPENNRLFYGSDAALAALAFHASNPASPLFGIFATDVAGAVAGGIPSFVLSDPDLTYSTGPNFAWMKTWGYGATIEAAINDNTTWKNIIAYRGLSWKAGMDLDGSPDTILHVSFNMHQHQFSEEMQLLGDLFNERLRYVIGGFYFSEAGDLHDLVPFPGNLLQVDGPNTLATWTYAFYGNLNIKVTDQVSLTLGGRYSFEHKEFEGFQSDPNDFTYRAGFPPLWVPCYPPGAPSPLPHPLTGAVGDCSTYFGFPVPGQPSRFFPAGVDVRKFYLFTPKIGLEWSPTDDFLAYFSWSKGYKSGGWTTRLSFPTQDRNGDGVTNQLDSPKFGPEKARTFELGFKSEWFNNQVRLNAAGFRTNYLDIQQNVFKFISPTIENSGDAHIHGAEVELTALLSDNFLVNAHMGWIKAKYVRLDPGAGDASISPAGCIPVPGPLPPPLVACERTVTLNSSLRKTPKWKFGLSPQYTVHLNEGWGDLVFNVDYSYTSSLFNDSENTPELKREPVTMVDLAITYKANSGNWEIAVGATNLTDERYIVSGQANRAGGNISGYFSAPRQWFATFRARY